MTKKKKVKEEVATRQFVKETVENAVDELAQATEKAFQKVATKEDLRRLEAKVEGLSTKVDGLDTKVEGMEDRIIGRIKSYFENRDAEVQGAHEDELDVVAGEKSAPAAWKSVPRRLKTVETEVEKIKDHIELP